MSFRFPRDLAADLASLSQREVRTKTAIVVRALRREIADSGLHERELALEAKPVDAPSAS